MAEQDLDGPEVGAGLQQMGGEAVPQGVDGDVLAQARGLARPGTHFRAPRCAVIGSIRDVTGEEPVGRPDRLPVLAEDREQSGREHDVAVLVPLGLADADDHPPAVDVVDPQGRRPRRRGARRRRRS